MPTYDYGAIGANLGAALFPDPAEQYQAEAIRSKAAAAAQEAAIASRKEQALAAAAPVLAQQLRSAGFGDGADAYAGALIYSDNPYQLSQGWNESRGGAAVFDGQGEVLRRGIVQQKLADDALKTGLIAPPGGTAGWEGQSVQAQNFNILQRAAVKMQGGTPLTPQEVVQVQMAYAHEYGPKRTIEGGVEYINTPEIPPGIANLPSLWAQTGSPPASPAQGAAPPAAGAPTAAGGAPVQPGGPGIAPGRQLVPPKPTEVEGKMITFGNRMQDQLDPLFKMVGFDPQTGAYDPSQATASNYDMWWNAIARQLPVEVSAQFRTNPGQQFMTSANSVLLPLLRLDSGAAINLQELPNYYGTYVPSPGEDEVSVRTKYQQLHILSRTMQILTERFGITPERVSSMSAAELQRLRPIVDQVKTEAAAAPQATGQAPAAPSGTTSTGIPWSVE